MIGLAWIKRALSATLCKIGVHPLQKHGRIEVMLPTGDKLTSDAIKAWLGPVVYVGGCRCCGKILYRREDWNE